MITIFEIKSWENDKLQIITKCQEWGLVPKEGKYKCPKCGDILKLVTTTSASFIDGYRWTCFGHVTGKRNKRQKCATRVSIRTGTFFEKSHLSIVDILIFAVMWMESVKGRFIRRHLKLSTQTYTEWSSFCREVTYHVMRENQEPIGGEGKTVEIECKFTKSKYERGRFIEENWTFGGYERGSGRVFIVQVQNRTRETLLDIINQWIFPGTSIIFDCWETFDCLPNEEYQQQKDNPSENTEESTWRALKLKVTPPIRKKQSLSNLARYMLLKTAKAKNADPVLYFYKMAGKLYNPLEERNISVRRPNEPANDTRRPNEEAENSNSSEEEDDEEF